MLPLLDTLERVEVANVAHGCVRTDKVAAAVGTDPDTGVKYTFIIAGAGGGMVTVRCLSDDTEFVRGTRRPCEVPDLIDLFVGMLNERVAA